MLNSNKVTNLNKIEYNKYSKQIILDNIGQEGQNRLKKAKILIIGAGGLGCPILTYIAASGIGKIGIIDHDQITISNLNRQTIYNLNNIHKNKTYYSKQYIKRINPKCETSIYNYELNNQNAINIIKNYDIIIDASDNFNTRYIIDEICYKLHKIHIYGAINKYEGQISVFNYKNNTRYSDLYPKQLNLLNNNCNSTGIIGVMTSTIGTLQATESIKIILGIGEILNGITLIYNLLNNSFKKIKINPQKVIKTKQITYHYLKYIKQHELNNSNISYIIIDVQNNTEFNKIHINQTINIPLRLFIYKKTIQFISKQSINKMIILNCNTASRATTASNILLKNKISNYILK